MFICARDLLLKLFLIYSMPPVRCEISPLLSYAGEVSLIQRVLFMEQFLSYGGVKTQEKYFFIYFVIFS